MTATSNNETFDAKRIAYCVHVDHENDRISRMYAWEIPADMPRPHFGETLLVENMDDTARVFFIIERQVIPIEPVDRKKVLGISNKKISLYDKNFSILFDAFEDIKQGIHTPDDFLGIEDGEFIGWRIPAEEQDVVPARRARRFRSARFKELKERLIAQIPDPEPKGVNESCAIKRLRKSANLIELMSEIYKEFLMFAEMNIITSKIMCDFRGLFKAHNIFYNEDSDHGRIYLDSGRDYESHRKAQVYICGDARMQAFGTSRVFATGQSRVEAWGKSEVLSEGCARVIAYGESTVEARSGEVYAYFNSSVKATNAIVRAYDKVSVYADGSIVWANEQATVLACGGADVVARDEVRVTVVGEASVSSWDNTFVLVKDDRATVKAGGNSCVVSTCNIACKLKGNATHHDTESNTLRVNSCVKVEVNQPED